MEERKHLRKKFIWISKFIMDIDRVLRYFFTALWKILGCWSLNFFLHFCCYSKTKLDLWLFIMWYRLRGTASFFDAVIIFLLLLQPVELTKPRVCTRVHFRFLVRFVFARSLVFCVLFCKSLFIFLSIFVVLVIAISVFTLRILITPLVPSHFSYIMRPS